MNGEGGWQSREALQPAGRVEIITRAEPFNINAMDMKIPHPEKKQTRENDDESGDGIIMRGIKRKNWLNNSRCWFWLGRVGGGGRLGAGGGGGWRHGISVVRQYFPRWHYVCTDYGSTFV